VNRGAYTAAILGAPHPERRASLLLSTEGKGDKRGADPTVATIRRHLEGELTIGLYAINPQRQRSKWLQLTPLCRRGRILLKLQYFLQEDKSGSLGE